MNKPLHEDEKIALIARAKEQAPGQQLFLAEYSFKRRDGATAHLCFVFQEPTTAQMQLYAEQAQRDALGANQQLLYQLAVESGKDEEQKPLLEQIGPHSAAIATWVQEYLNPLYGVPLESKPVVAI